MAKITKEAFEGMSVLPLTPLHDDLSVNKEAIGEVVEMMVGYGMRSIWTNGFCAESLKLSAQAVRDSLSAYLDAGKGKTVMGAGISSYKPYECVELGKYAESIGYDFLWFTPSPLAQSDEEILRQFKYVIDNTTLPLALYNSSGTGVYLSPILMRDVLALAPERFVAVKDSQGCTAHITEIFRLGIPDRLTFVTTADSNLYSLCLGSKGIVGTPEHVVLGKALYDAFMAGDYEKAKFYQYRLDGGFPMMGPASPFIQTRGVSKMPVHMADQKYAISLVTGIDHGPCMPPTLHAPAPVLENIRRFIEWWKPYDADAPLPETEICDILGVR